MNNNALMSIKNVRGFVDSQGTAQLNLEDVARGLGFTRTAASGNETIRWERVDAYLEEIGIPTSGHDGFIPENVFYRLAFKAKNKVAEEFQAMVCDDILPTIRRTGKYEYAEYKMMAAIEAQGKKLAELAAIIEKRHKPFTDPRHMYDYARGQYSRATGDDSSRGIGYAIKEYYGECPYASEIKPLSVKDWVCRNIGGDEIQSFADAIFDGLIVKTKAGRWVNLSGVFSNNYEIPRLHKEFNNECAYCGSVDNLVIEHVNPQVKYSAIDPSKVDLIGNCIIACQCCNKAKNDTMPYKHWYNSDLPSYRQWREKKIDEHIKQYEVV